MEKKKNAPAAALGVGIEEGVLSTGNRKGRLLGAFLCLSHLIYGASGMPVSSFSAIPVE